MHIPGLGSCCIFFLALPKRHGAGTCSRKYALFQVCSVKRPMASRPNHIEHAFIDCVAASLGIILKWARGLDHFTIPAPLQQAEFSLRSRLFYCFACRKRGCCPAGADGCRSSEMQVANRRWSRSLGICFWASGGAYHYLWLYTERVPCVSPSLAIYFFVRSTTPPPLSVLAIRLQEYCSQALILSFYYIIECPVAACSL